MNEYITWFLEVDASLIWVKCLDFLSSIPTSLLPKVQLGVWVKRRLVWPHGDDKQRVYLLTSGSSLTVPQSLY